MAVLMVPPYLQFLDDDGAPLAGGFVYTYTATGTFTIPKATYTTAAGNVEQTNPIVLDASGRPTLGNGSIWLSGTYDFKVTDSLGNIIETTQNVTAFTTLPSASDAYFESFSGNGTQTAFTTSSNLGADEKAIYVWVNNGLAECSTNGTFASDSGWTQGAGWTIATGTAIATGAISTAISQIAARTIVAGQAYAVTYTITQSAGSLVPSVGGNAGVARSSSGTYSEVIVAGTTQILAFTGSGFTGTLDNVSITVADSTGYEIQNPANYTINGTVLTFLTAPPTGTGNIYVSAPSLLVGAASSSAANAAASAAAAAASAAAAAASAGQLTITSTTSLLIGTGSKVFTVASGLALNAGQFIIATSNANPSVNYMWGQIASYSGVTLTITVASTGGSGTFADWTMYLTGARGAIGATGSIGDLSGVPSGTIALNDKLIFDDVSAANATAACTLSAIIGMVYPIGSYYINETDNTNPATLFGFGTWVAVTDKFIVGHGSTYTTTGGAATVTLVQGNLPSSITVTQSNSGTADNSSGGNSFFAGADAGALTRTVTLGLGSNTAFSIIPTYQAAYIWKRTV